MTVKILKEKVLPLGGFEGNSESTTILHLNTPPSYGVPTIEIVIKTCCYNV